MSFEELLKVVDFIETYYSINLKDNQIRSLQEELKDYTYESFINEVKEPLLKSISFFNIADLHRILENIKDSKKFLEQSGKSTWEEFYANNN